MYKYTRIIKSNRHGVKMAIALIRIFIVLQREVRMFYKQLNKICGCLFKGIRLLYNISRPFV